MSRRYVQYGCGLCAPPEWENYDASPTLRMQKLPLIGHFVKSISNIKFPENVMYGDIIKGLPVPEDSCNGMYCSHTLEHLSLNDFRKALKNTYKILKPGGVFRCVVPDLEFAAKNYITSINDNNESASIQFMKTTLLGMEDRKKGVKAIITSVFGNSHHLWMWDQKSLQKELKEAGFKEVRICSFNDSNDKMFHLVESEDRFMNSVAAEGIK